MAAGAAAMAGTRGGEVSSELAVQDWADRVVRPKAESPDGWTKAHLSLKEKVVTQNVGSQKARSELEESLSKVREAYQAQMMLLKELELERIDLQSSVHRLVSMRQNWRSQYADYKLAPSSELEERLEKEERAAVSEVQAADARIALVSAQVNRLRGVKDALNRRLSEKRHHLHVEGQILAACQSPLERPSSSRLHTPKSSKWAYGIKNPYLFEGSPRQALDAGHPRTAR
mmetsp:Transcript_133358/g.231639  ORF Transcript_133358/g.231639 Transcript_133358/m.231639 type:complete len:230 (+) Transcript_133358:99-788(+)